MSVSFSLDHFKMCFHFQNLVLWYYTINVLKMCFHFRLRLIFDIRLALQILHLKVFFPSWIDSMCEFKNSHLEMKAHFETVKTKGNRHYLNNTHHYWQDFYTGGVPSKLFSKILYCCFDPLKLFSKTVTCDDLSNRYNTIYKLQNLESQFCELLRPCAPPFQKIKRISLNLVTFMQKSCFLGPTIFKFHKQTDTNTHDTKTYTHIKHNLKMKAHFLF